MALEKRTCRFEVKELAEDTPGQFSGIASVYGVTDLQGDVVMPGAFTKTIEERGRELPILWQHHPDTPIGVGTLSDSGPGLLLAGSLVLDVQKAREAYALLKAKAVKGLSIGYEVIKDRMENGVRQLLEIRLWEVSLVTFAANPLAQVTGVKDIEGLAAVVAELKEGRVLSRRNRQTLADAVALLSELLAAAGEDAGDKQTDPASTGTPPAPKGEEPPTAPEPELLHSLRAFTEDVKAAADAAARRKSWT